MQSRRIKILFGSAIGLYMALVCFNNIFDYGSNFQFVSMVSGMEDIFSKDRNGWRSLHSHIAHHLLYIFIILWEITTAVLIISGVLRMVKTLKSDTDTFNHSKNSLAMGIAMGILLWFVFFIVIGGEWFLMWQSKNWNGQTNAFFLTISFLLFLIYLNQTDL
ncbi:MAG: DUF2165 domain-containing protein [Bacteroidetes bacterium]|nr:DUF2165 domain-containing protein [Bacteroidota bacterium]